MRIGVALSKVLARMHLWYPTAVVLAQTSLAELDRHSIGRLSYALMMANRTRHGSANALLQRILEDNAKRTPAITLELAEMAIRIEQPSLAEDLLLDAEASADAVQDGSTSDAARRLRALAIALRDGSLETHVRKDIDAIAVPAADAPMVLVPLSGAYLELFHLWLRQVRKHAGQHIVALAMDDAALEALRQEGNVVTIDCRGFFSWHEGRLHPRTRGVLWLVRVLYLRAMVQRGYTTLVLDLDAVPVGDIAPVLRSTSDCDVVAQIDHSIPMDVNRQLGFVLCCGFMIWRPTVAAKALLDRFAAATQIERDDQLALNHLLASDGVVEKTAGEDAMRFGSAGVQFACPDPSLVSRSLRSGSVVRHFHQHGQSIEELYRDLGIS